MKQDIILGIHGYSYDSPRQMHDAGACIVANGDVLAAVDEERISRAKRDGRFPMNAYRLAMEIAGVDPEEITGIAFPDRRSVFQTYWVWRYALESFLRSGAKPLRYLWWWNHNIIQFSRCGPPELKTRVVKFFEHHRCHAASAYYSGPWENSTVVTLDGMGDFSIGGSVYSGRNGSLRLLHRSNGYFSPGHFYMIVTEYLGFTPGRHEGKVAGLAAHGNPEKAYHTMEKIIRYRKGKMDFVAGPVAEEFFSVIRSRPGTRTREWYSQHKWVSEENALRYDQYRFTGESLKYFRKVWRDYSKEDIAAAAQKRLEDIIVAYVKDAMKRVGEACLTVAGGTFANVHVNQCLRELPEVSNIYVHPNMSDGGLSVGAAQLLYHDLREKKGGRYIQQQLENVYLGPAFGGVIIEAALKKAGLSYSRPIGLAQIAAEAISSNMIVAVFQGRMEYGPRALGNRSLLVSATEKRMHHVLNQRLNRSEIMPFAPVILEEYASTWLEGWKEEHVASRFMTTTYNLNRELTKRVPATVHLDGTVRPQVVRRRDNPLIHSIVSNYCQLTGIPLVINTSFNMHEEPIVCSPNDAIDTFQRGAADVMIIGPFLVESAQHNG